MVKTLTLYKRIVEELGLRQLDVYRVRDSKGTLKDVLRLFDPATNKVFTLDLGKVREALQPGEFLEAIIKAADEAEVRLPDRIVTRLRELFSKPAEESQEL